MSFCRYVETFCMHAKTSCMMHVRTVQNTVPCDTRAILMVCNPHSCSHIVSQSQQILQQLLQNLCLKVSWWSVLDQSIVPSQPENHISTQPILKIQVDSQITYLEILKGWQKGSIFTRQHTKKVHQMQMSLLLNVWFQKISRPPPWRELEIPGGWGGQRPRKFQRGGGLDNKITFRG